MQVLQEDMRAGGKRSFSTLVDTSRPLPQVDDVEMFFIVGTTAVTVTVDLNYAVGGFTLLFHALRRWSVLEINDLSSAESGHAKMMDAPTIEDLFSEIGQEREEPSWTNPIGSEDAFDDEGSEDKEA